MKKIFLTLTLLLFVIPLGISQDLPSYVPTDGLVAYYPFNGNANDASGNGKNGTVDGANLTSGRFDNETSSYSFDGEDDWIDFIEHPNLKIKNSLTYSAWINIEGMTNFMGIVGTGEGTVLTKTSSMLMVNTDYNLVFEIGNGSERKTITDVEKILDQNNWYHVVGTFNSDDGFIKLYLDGLLVESLDTNISSLLTDIPDSDNRFKIGVRDLFNSGYTYGWFKGKIDDVGIWNRALTEQEIQNLYTSSTGDILLNGVVSAENNQIRNVADPTHGKDAVTKDYLLEKIALLQDQIDAMQAVINSGTVTDQDGNSYPYLTYGDQVWTVKNAEMVTYRDGTPIPQVTDATEWANLTTGAWCYYDNDPSKGKLYNWYAVAGIHDNDENTPNKEFAPEGWHVPTDAEWTTLENYLIANGYNYDDTTTENKIGKAMASTTGWNTSAVTGAVGNDQSLNNSSGFNAFPEGYRYYEGSFNTEGYFTIFWSSTNLNPYLAWNRYLDSNISDLVRDYFAKRNGFSVRFVRD